jgi:hypothetical protein
VNEVLLNPIPVAATSAQLDQDLARQLAELAAEAHEAPLDTRLRPALIEAGVWAVAALSGWVAAAWLA